MDGTKDAYFGLEDPTPEEWERWHEALLAERSRAGEIVYADESTAWSDASFRQVFLFMYDGSFFDGRYRTAELIASWRQKFGRVDSVLLWHAYPRLGFDARTQFDFYRDMPGGLARLRVDVCDVFHAAGIRVFVDYNPWDAGTYDELGEIVAALDADGVMLDTMAGAPDELEEAVRRHKSGVVFAPELRPTDADLARFRQSWAQWFELGDDSTPSILRHQWLVPQHRQLAIRRWDRSRRRDIAYSFWCGSGLILWENIFGTWNPYDREDRRLIAETGAVIDHYGDLFARGTWRPLVPTGTRGLDANVWSDGKRSITTLRNRTHERLVYRAPDPPSGLVRGVCWGARDLIEVAPGGVQAVIVDNEEAVRAALAHFDQLSANANVDLPDDARPPPSRVTVPRTSGSGPGMIAIPGGTFTMRITHERRECGCYPEGATDDAMWGWFYKDVLTHELRTTIAPFAMKRTAVTNREFLEFVHATSYRPTDPEHFLAHLPRTELTDDLGALPVTFVSLADARAYAAWRGQRLPTEAEWQWAAEGAGSAHRFPWGNEERTFPPELRPARDEATATRHGILGLSANAWELTDSEHTDGHTRFVMLRGGVHLPPGESEWLVARGPRPNDSHAKYILLSDGLDRSATVSFRTVCD